jgi:alpha-L-fucosidase
MVYEATFDFVDIVSKNGNLLLNVAPMGQSPISGLTITLPERATDEGTEAVAFAPRHQADEIALRT